jgi:hypothetical protein
VANVVRRSKNVFVMAMVNSNRFKPTGIPAHGKMNELKCSLPLNVSVREFGDHNAALDSFESE